MTQGQAIITACSFGYLLIACGWYAYIMTKLTPYMNYLPPMLTPPFVRLGVGVITFGWPLVIACYGYIKLIMGMGKLAGVKWDEVLPKFDNIKMGVSGHEDYDPDLPFSAQIAPIVKGLHVSMIMHPQGQDPVVREATWMKSENLNALMSSKTSLGIFLCKHAMKPHDTTDVEPEANEDVESAAHPEDHHG